MRERGKVVVKTRRILMVLSIVLLMGLYSGVVYANDSSEGYNIEKTTAMKNNKEVEILQSKDGYLKITQIGQNSQNVKVATSTFDEKILISGRANKGTSLIIGVYQEDKQVDQYSTSVGSKETFSQTVDILEGNNDVHIYYKNENDGVDDYVIISICRESVENMEKLKAWSGLPSL